ncbi:hypothetical protein CANINC_000622 [Pichia inconspicua]|uniref:Uncharacterized protein n=1 Tax=Pichia inconspicua TaxID=52247 RepID=A0A4T0X5F6_9ASCO|nr:hypothetical protein CANINC_000622 [[Candida] inconspicua]
MIFRRSLSTFTTINPNKVVFHQPLNHSSLILISTPSQLKRVIQRVSDEQSKSNKLNQILVACVDTICGSRNAISELWTNKFSIINHETIGDRNERLTPKKDALSVNPVKFDKSWKNNTLHTLFDINIGGFNPKIRLANTLFANGEESTCFYVGNSSIDWFNLSSVKVIIDENIKISEKSYKNRLTEIPFELNNPNGEYKITSYEGNLIKSINNQSTSGYLIDNAKVMDGKKDLYFKLYDANTSIEPWNEELYKLVVGGLGWGEKQAFLAVDPDALNGDVGYRNVKLFYYDTQRGVPTIPESGIVVECSEKEEGFNEASGETVEMEGVFGMGSEEGFEVNGVWHRANGEQIVAE